MEIKENAAYLEVNSNDIHVVWRSGATFFKIEWKPQMLSQRDRLRTFPSADISTKSTKVSLSACV